MWFVRHYCPAFSRPLSGCWRLAADGWRLAAGGWRLAEVLAEVARRASRPGRGDAPGHDAGWPGLHLGCTLHTWSRRLETRAGLARPGRAPSAERRAELSGNDASSVQGRSNVVWSFQAVDGLVDQSGLKATVVTTSPGAWAVSCEPAGASWSQLEPNPDSGAPIQK